ncbi:MAG: sulfatase, partial [Planctomycetes bacterium]|nr:sulfatase [Planctomycetota bacterium]
SQEGNALSLVRCVTVALSVAIIGGTLIGVAESTLAGAVAIRGLQGQPWPTGVFFAVVGKTTVSHCLLWCPVLAACALLYAPLARRRARAPEPFLTALFVALSGVVVVPADLALAKLGGRMIHVAACAGVLVVAATTYVLVRVLHRKLGSARVRRIRNLTTAICATMTVASGIAFARSPLFDAGAYRVRQVSRVAQPPSAGEDGSSVSHSGAGVPRRAPNVLWIVLDTVRADHLSCYGHAAQISPFLAEWASHSIIFDRAVADGIWTIPSHASMFTGLSVREHGVDYPNIWLDDSIPTVADELAAKGYTTASFSNNPWISTETNLAKGFEISHMVNHLRRMTRFSLEYVCEKWGVTPPLPWLDGDYGAALTNDLIADWLDARTDDAPLFLFVNYMEAHLPYRVPKRYRRMYLNDAEVDRSYDLRRRTYGNIVTALHYRFNFEGPDFMDVKDRDVLKRQYEATVRYLDDRTRELIGIFDQRGLLDETLVIIASDHGEYLDTHGMWSHRFGTYDDVARAVLLVREPGRQRGVRISTPVQLSDLFYTVLKAAFIESPEANRGAHRPLQGRGTDEGDIPRPSERMGHAVMRDLIAVAAAGGAARVAITEYRGPTPTRLMQVVASNRTSEDEHFRSQTAAQDGRFKYIVSSDGHRELYNFRVDPGELYNLVEILPDEARRFAGYIKHWRATTPLFDPSQTATTRTLSPSLLDALRSLGYVNPQED